MVRKTLVEKTPVYELGSQDPVFFEYGGVNGASAEIWYKYQAKDTWQKFKGGQQFSFKKNLPLHGSGPNPEKIVGEIKAVCRNGDPFYSLLIEEVEFLELRLWDEHNSRYSFLYRFRDPCFTEESFGVAVDDLLLESTLTFKCSKDLTVEYPSD